MTPLPPPFAVMLKPRGAICNLDCAYCYYLPKENLYPASDFRMSDAVLETYTRQYIASQPGPEILFAWQGGEPLLMGLDFFRRALALQRKHCPPGKFIANTLQTNGVLLDADWCRFFKAHNFLIGLSLDGPRELHDAYRVDKGGRHTHERVLAGVRSLQAHHVDFNILTTVHAANAAHPLEVYRFLRDEIGAAFIQFIPIVERQNTTGFQEGETVTRRSVGAQAYGDFLCAVFDEWVRRDMGQVFVQIFDMALGVWLGYPASLCVFAETCGLGLALEHTGDLYACDHFVEPRYRLGNIEQTPLTDLVLLPAQQAFGLAKREALPCYCRECPVLFACHGECPKNRFSLTPDGEPGLNYLCAGYKTFFAHIDPYLRRMAAELAAGRPAANVMHLAVTEQRRPTDEQAHS